jgi:outer membrane autotransporter protein
MSGVAANVSVSAGASVTGGAGGDGGAVVNGDGAGGGAGGSGGAGALLAAGSSLNNLGTITGGAGGLGALASPGPTGSNGAGGVGISGADLRIVNAGAISGGLSGATRANAVEFQGTANRLEIQAGANFVGNVVGSTTVGATNTLALGGLGNGTFGVGAIGNQFQNFNSFVKTGSGSWILTGTTTQLTPWTVSEGVLSISSDANLGAPGSTLRLAGGTLQTTADISSARTIDVNAVGGTVSPDANTTLTLNGAVSGAGALTMAGAGTLVLASTNTYTGGTLVRSGTLVAGSATALSQNTAYVVNGGTLNLGTWNLTTSSLSGAGGTVALNAQNLTVAQAADTSFSGSIAGSGSLTKTGAGILTLSGNSSYTGGTTLKEGRINVGSNTALGTGELAMDDGTTLGLAAAGLTLNNAIRMTGRNDPVIDTGAFSGTLTGSITGTGFLTKQGVGVLTLAGNNTYSGATLVEQGTLRAGAANTFSAGSATSVAPGATLDLAGFNQTLASVNNGGTVSLVGASPGTVLTINGPWVGNNGVLGLGTTLGGNASATDRLILNGPSAIASGTTRVAITNLGGLGGQTNGNGIEIVSTQNGATIGTNAFTLAAPVSAGAFDYRLASTSSAAYLTNTTQVSTTPTYRAEVPLYAALASQFRESNLAMLGNMHQRVGDDGVTGANTTTLEQGYRQAWGRVISIDRDIAQSGTVSPNSSGRLTGFQAGTDLWANANWRAGVYVGQLEGDMRVSGFARGILNYAAGSNDLRSQYLGTYATWKSDTGLYVDGVLQAGRHRYTAGPTLAASSGGKGDSLLASVEVGQAFRVAPNWVVEPQVQLVHQRIDLNDTAIVGALVQQDSASGWTARAGVRVKGEFQTGAGTVQPYARVNFYKRSSETDVTRFVGPAGFSDIATRTGGTSSELAVGATWQLSVSTSLYGEVGKLWAAGGDARTKSGINGSLGVKVRW